MEKSPLKPGAQRIVSIADRGREGRSGGCGDDGAQLPSTGQCGYEPGGILHRRKIPHEGSGEYLADVEVARAQPGRLYQQ